MKKFKFISLALIGAYALLTAACVKEITSNEELYRPVGSPILFTASTGYDNGVATKAEYSGYLNGTPTWGNSTAYERINWEDEDPVLIEYNGNSSPYYIDGDTVTPNEEFSLAELSEGDLTWDGSGNHIFYALYPDSGILDGNKVTGFIPAVQNVDDDHTITVGGVTKYQPNTQEFGYLVAREVIPGSSPQSSVTLKFRPAFTTFEFKLNRGTDSPNPKLMSATLETETVDGTTYPLAGKFQITLTGTDATRGATWNTSRTGTDPTVVSSATGYTLSNSINVSFGDGVYIPVDSYLDFSVLCLPIELKGLKLTLHFAGNIDKVLRFKNKAESGEPWYTFAAAKKYIITNVAPQGEWIYKIDTIDDITTYGHEEQLGLGFNVKSYKYNTLDPTFIKPVPWKIKYSTDEGHSWHDVVKSGSTGTTGTEHTITSSTSDIVTGSGWGGTGAGEPRSANITGEADGDQPGEDTVPAIRADLRTRTPYSNDSENPWDLSMHTIFGTSHAMTTANSYVVDRPGWYMFPVVYGNGITNASINANAYRPGEGGDPNVTLSSIYANNLSVPQFRYFRDFFDAAGGGINHPVIMTSYSNWPGETTPTDLDAVIIWQNSMTGEEIVTSNPSLLDVDTGVAGIGTIKYIAFQVKPEDIQPGNIVLAFRGKVSGRGLTSKTILWSWQIWVTQADLHPVTVGSAAFMPRNLGAVDNTRAQILKYEDRSIKYKIVQIDDLGNELPISPSTGAEEDFLVEEIGDAHQIAANQGNSTFYQWGRKDPLVPVNPDGSTDVTYVTPGEEYASVDFTHQLQFSYSSGTNIAPLDVKSSIQHPYWLCQNLGIATWIGGHDYAGRDGKANQACLPFNLWNSYISETMDAGGSHKYKTVYDPCPPGFCVPNVGALSGFQYKSMDSGGVTIEGGMYFPFTGQRVLHPGVIDTERVGVDGYYWTDCPEDEDSDSWTVSHHLAKSFAVSSSGNIYIPAANLFHQGDVSCTRGCGMAIRPMVDPKY